MSGAGGVAMGPDHLILLLAALALDAYVGDWFMGRGGSWHPAAIVIRLAGGLERRLNRAARGEGALRVRGALATAAILGAAVAAGIALDFASDHAPLLWVAEFGVIAVVIESRAPYSRIADLAAAIEDGVPADAEATLARIAPRDPVHADAHEMARIGIEALAVGLATGVVGPVLAYLVLGSPGLLGYCAVRALGQHFGRGRPETVAFGAAARVVERIVAVIPGPLGALAIAVAALAQPRASSWRAFVTIARDARRHPDAGAGWPVAAMAGALGLALAGPRRYTARVVKDPWIGRGRARAEPEDMRRALGLFVRAVVLLGAMIVLGALARGGG
ncbi:MAG: cobalamin biosynthesis protein [Alphaproteobacteria bacterium]|nr:cobalamin biosynthesis protein [Alphaproteobacteria bacterium]